MRWPGTSSRTITTSRIWCGQSALHRYTASAWSRTPTTPGTRGTSRVSCRGVCRQRCCWTRSTRSRARRRRSRACRRPRRAVQLPDNQFESYFLSAFGRPDSASACECERNGDASLAQALHLFNSEELLEKISGRKTAIPAAPAADVKPKKERTKPQNVNHRARRRTHQGIDGRQSSRCRRSSHDLYLIALSRKPTQEETETMLAHIKKKERYAGGLRGHPLGSYQHQGIPLQPLSGDKP